MKKLSITTALAACALVVAPSLVKVTAAPPVQYCYTVSCRGPAHKQLGATACGPTDGEARSSAEKWLGAHRGTGHTPSLGKMFQR
jgi:hypothetical protein